jgi:hypothetical protein
MTGEPGRAAFDTCLEVRELLDADYTTAIKRPDPARGPARASLPATIMPAAWLRNSPVEAASRRPSASIA